MNDRRTTIDSISGVLFGLGLLASIAELVFRPFLFAPLGLVVILIGGIMSSKYRRVGLTAAMLLAACFVIGAAIAVWYSRALY